MQQCYCITGETDFVLIMNASDMDE
ncbi:MULTISPECIES: Lrp/AsnC ligand binding domain-containing protein [Mesorhizobium]|nr:MULTISPECIES: Lrp/AsnC ligand binding domain-containing protein [Mesorhizobium]MCV3243384.1 Lrp/AsnC ligand binding domain-containing protein [Mesorhizobium sp. ZC-5]